MSTQRVQHPDVTLGVINATIACAECDQVDKNAIYQILPNKAMVLIRENYSEDQYTCGLLFNLFGIAFDPGGL
jgi:hypothetical protein